MLAISGVRSYSCPHVIRDQKANEKVLQLLAFIAGFALQNIYVTLWVGLGGAALTFLVVVPPYPFYNKSPERWLPKGIGMSGSGIKIDGKKIN